mmetsp:Transcript_14325/g.21453  ORF Transcript_14325/g.21453 Transcript_14325/m.21453 type:complete len:836 (+) Transcript_14325:123-2630(+)|eukprot:CAMPEP_0185039872 /NCGR_PEP_ID=MMETSP1103-20130426/37230_1 /TAXON_ID=36769 /ORGANISM="Paraphysomonas bandaiensis, Strain Caron Lab Isolate" /LENGTH=835 /DNA_ID=CAMNT_0027578927 /DNA_START=61 /DNA_END=2568 /DNA_ORIENTATION=-
MKSSIKYHHNEKSIYPSSALPLPLNGISLSTLLRIRDYIISNDYEITCKDVCSRYIRIWTQDEDLKTSYCNHYKEKQKQKKLLNEGVSTGISIGRADVYVIYGHMDRFIDVVTGIENHFSDRHNRKWKCFTREPYIWMDMFSLSLWDDSFSSYRLSDSYGNSLLNIGHVLLVITPPSHDPSILIDLLSMWDLLNCLYVSLLPVICVGGNVSTTSKFHELLFQDFGSLVRPFEHVNFSLCSSVDMSIDETTHKKFIDEAVWMAVQRVDRDPKVYEDWRELYNNVRDGNVGEVNVGERTLQKQYIGQNSGPNRYIVRTKSQEVPVVALNSQHSAYMQAIHAISSDLSRFLVGWLLGYAYKVVQYGDGGADEMATLESCKLLGHMLMEYDRLEESEIVLVQCLRDAESLLGMNHPFRILVLVALRSLYVRRQLYQQAEDAAEKVYAINKEKGNSIHFVQAACAVADIQRQKYLSLRSLSPVREMEWEDEALLDALELYTEGLRVCERLEGEGCSELMLSIHFRLAEIYCHLRQYSDAERHHYIALNGFSKHFGESHSATQRCIEAVAQLCIHLERYDEAECLCRKALAAKERQYHCFHNEINAALRSLGEVLELQSKRLEAADIYARELRGRERTLGDNHPLTLAALKKLGKVQCEIGKYDESEQAYRTLLDRLRLEQDKRHCEVAEVLTSLRDMYWSQDKLVEAEEVCRREIKLRERTVGKRHPSTLTAVHSLGDILRREIKLYEAQDMYKTALKGREAVLGINHEDTILSVHGLATVCERRGDFKGAEQAYSRVYEWMKRNPSTHSCDDIRDVALRFSDALLKGGKTKESEDVLKI